MPHPTSSAGGLAKKKTSPLTELKHMGSRDALDAIPPLSAWERATAPIVAALCACLVLRVESSPCGGEAK